MTAPDPRLEEIEGRYQVPWLVAECSPESPASVYEEADGLETICCIPGYYSPEAQNHLARQIAAAPADVAYLLAELRKAQDKLARVEGLHRPVKKWEPYEGAGYSFNTREDALEAAGEEDLGVVAIEAGPQFFEVCKECSRVEGEQLAEIGEEWGYRESLWPCPTAAAVADATGGGDS